MAVLALGSATKNLNKVGVRLLDRSPPHESAASNQAILTENEADARRVDDGKNSDFTSGQGVRLHQG